MNKHIIGLIVIIVPYLSLCMQEMHLNPIHTPQQVIESYNNTIVVYAATSAYLTGPAGFVLSPYNNNYIGFVSTRMHPGEQSSIADYQASHSLKKFINVAQWPFRIADDQESLLSPWAIKEGNLKMRRATRTEAKMLCKLWCPDIWDFDYEQFADIIAIATEYCCLPDECCPENIQQSKITRWEQTLK